MKRMLFLLALLLALTGCGEAEQIRPEEETTPVQQVEAEPEQSEIQPEPEETPVPEEPEQQPEAKAPQAAYWYEDKAVAEDGTVVLCVPEHTLRLIRDELTGKPRWILAQDSEGAYDGLYELDGTPIQTDVMGSFSVAGDLLWYQTEGGVCVVRVSDGTVLDENLEQVRLVGGRAALIPSYRLGSIRFLEPQTGEETGRLESGFTCAEVTNSDGGYLAVRSPDGQSVNLVDSEGTPLLSDFAAQIEDVCFGYAMVRKEAEGDLRVVELSTQREVYRSDREFILLPGAVLVCQRERQWQLQSWQGEALYDEVLIDRPEVYEEDGVPQYLVGQVLRGTEFVPVILRPDGTVLGELPADPTQIGLASAGAVTYVLKTGRGEEAHLYLLETGEDVLLARGGEIVLSAGLERSPADYEQVRQIETSGGKLFVLTVDNTLRLYLNDGTPARQDLGTATYLGGDVFHTETGLRRLDGSWVYNG